MAFLCSDWMIWHSWPHAIGHSKSSHHTKVEVWGHALYLWQSQGRGTNIRTIELWTRSPSTGLWELIETTERYLQACQDPSTLWSWRQVVPTFQVILILRVQKTSLSVCTFLSVHQHLLSMSQTTEVIQPPADQGSVSLFAPWQARRCK